MESNIDYENSCYLLVVCCIVLSIVFLFVSIYAAGNAARCSQMKEELDIIRVQLNEERKGRIDDLHQLFKQDNIENTNN